MAYELNIVKTDRDHLMQTINSMHRAPPTGYWYNSGAPGMHSFHDPASVYSNNIGIAEEMMPYDDGVMASHHGNGLGYYDNEQCNCQECIAPDFSEQSTAIPFSEDEWASFCGDDCDESSDNEAIGGEGEDVVSSSESQKTTTSSRVAKKIKTGEAVHRVKKSYAKETRNRKPMLSPKLGGQDSARKSGAFSPTTSSPVSPSSKLRTKGGDPVESVSLVTRNNDLRVQGRRELGGNMGNMRHSYSHRNHQPRFGGGENNGRRSSLESSSTINQPEQQRPLSRNSKQQQQHDSISNYSSFQPNTVSNFDDAISAAAQAQNSYYEGKNLGTNKNSPRDQLTAPFLNQNFEKKKKKRSFILKPFGRK